MFKENDKNNEVSKLISISACEYDIPKLSAIAKGIKLIEKAHSMIHDSKDNHLMQIFT